MPHVKQQNNLAHLQKHFGLDHLEIFGTFFDETIFEGVDFENSNFISFKEFIGVKHEVPNYAYKIMFSRNNYPYFAYYKGKKVGHVVHNDYVCVYSTTFRLEGIDYILENILAYFQLRSDGIKRMDICLDMILPIETIRESVGVIHQKHREYKGEGGKLESFYIGDNSHKNKRQFIRIYDKLLDIYVKRKGILYADYTIHNKITRIELEFRRELCKNITLSEIIVHDNLVAIFKNYVTKHTRMFDFISENKITLYAKPKEVPFDILQSVNRKNERKKVFRGHARSLLDSGVCPLYDLMWEGIYSEDARRILTESGSLEALKIRVAKADYWVDELLSLVP